MLADVAFPPGLNSWLACAFYTAGGIYVASKLVRSLRGRPATGELDIRVTNVERNVQRVEGKVEDLRESIVANGDLRKAAIESKLNDVRLELKGDIRELDKKISSSTAEQTKQLIIALKGKHD